MSHLKRTISRKLRRKIDEILGIKTSWKTDVEVVMLLSLYRGHQERLARKYASEVVQIQAMINAKSERLAELRLAEALLIEVRNSQDLDLLRKALEEAAMMGAITIN